MKETSGKKLHWIDFFLSEVNIKKIKVKKKN